MLDPKYLGNFDSRSDVEKEFSLGAGYLDNVEIFIAAYETPAYEGVAFELFRENGKLYEVHASHCSCYGLEGQFDPEETSVEALEAILEKGNLYLDVVNELKEVIVYLKNSKGVVVKKIVKFEAEDGTQFETEEACVNYERCSSLQEALYQAGGLSLDSEQVGRVAKWINSNLEWTFKT